MRNIKYIVIHCTATPQNTNINSIKNYWKNVLKWKNVGYHYIIKPDGRVIQLESIENQTNGVKGYNSESIHLSYIGGEKKDNRTLQQKESILILLQSLKGLYPNATILGHRDFPNVNKACPQFDAINEYKNI